MFQCTMSCGGGVQRREVKCLDDGRVASLQCLSASKPDTRRTCNRDPCPAHGEQLKLFVFLCLSYMRVKLNGELSEEVDCFKYLGSQAAANGGCERDVVHRLNVGYRA